MSGTRRSPIGTARAAPRARGQAGFRRAAPAFGESTIDRARRILAPRHIEIQLPGAATHRPDFVSQRSGRRRRAAWLSPLLVWLLLVASPVHSAIAAGGAALEAAGAGVRGQFPTQVQARAQARTQGQADAGLPQAQLAEARRLFDTLDYEQALVRLDLVVSALQARRAQPATAALPAPATASAAATAGDTDGAALTRMLIEALELRARAHFGVGQQEPAREDFRALLALRPDYAPGETVSPRVIAFFKEIRAGLIGQVQIIVEPADAIARIDGQRTGPFGEPLDIVAGPHVLGILRSGYRPDTRDFIVDPGKLVELRVTMERSSATLAITTRPAGVEVKVDGVSRGITQTASAGSGATQAGAASGAAAASVPGSAASTPASPASAAGGSTGATPTPATEREQAIVSAPLLVSDLGVGSHRIELSRPCHAPATQTVAVDQLGDFRIGPVVLEPAVATLQVGASIGADIYLDGERRGGVPQTIERVCAGTHVIEARTASARDLRRVEVKAGERLTVTLTPRPALALLGNAGLLSGAPEDVRARVERALAPAARVLVWTPPLAEVRRAEVAERAPAGWLAVGPGGTPGAGGEWASASAAAARRDLSSRLAKALGVQGLIAISRAPERPGMVWLAILAAGASEPEVIPLEIERPAAAIAALDEGTVSGANLLSRTLDLALVDVLDRPGPVVLASGLALRPAAAMAATRPGGAASPSDASSDGHGLVPGDAIVELNGQPVARVQDVRRLLDAAGAAASVRLRAMTRAGQEKQVTRPVRVEPRLLFWPPAAGPGLPTLALLELRVRLAEATGLEAAAIRLNLAAALTTVGDAAGALALLDEASQALPGSASGLGPTTGSAVVAVQRALALEALGRTAEARSAWQAAQAASPVVDSGLDEVPSVGEVAARRLREGARP